MIYSLGWAEWDKSSSRSFTCVQAASEQRSVGGMYVTNNVRFKYQKKKDIGRAAFSQALLQCE